MQRDDGASAEWRRRRRRRRRVGSTDWE